MGMWDKDIVYGGERLDENVVSDGAAEYVLLDCGIVATNVKTDLGDDGTKAEVILGLLKDGAVTNVAKYGTFASAIIGKVMDKGEGDLPAVITFSKVPSSQAANQDAFVFTFVRPYSGTVPEHSFVIPPPRDMKGQTEAMAATPPRTPPSPPRAKSTR